MRARSVESADEDAAAGPGKVAVGGTIGGGTVGAGGGAGDGAAEPPGKHANPTHVATQTAPALQSEGAVHPPQWPFTHRAKGHWMSMSLAQNKPMAAALPAGGGDAGAEGG